MASTQIQTTTSSRSWAGHSPCVTRAGSRLWQVTVGGTDASNPGVCLWYSDNDGTNWTKHSQLDSSTADLRATIDYYFAGTILAIATAGGNVGGTALKFHHISSNVASGTPGAATTVTVDAGGANAGTYQPHLFSTETGTNPRFWIVGGKQTSATVWETRVWYALTTALSSWATITGTETDGVSHTHNAWGAHWTVGGANKATIVMQTPNSAANDRLIAFTFDPTASTPALGSGTQFGALSSGSMGDEIVDYVGMQAGAVKADYLVYGRYDRIANTVSFYKTVNGTTWTTPTGWTGLTMGRFTITLSSPNFIILHTASYGAPSTTAQDLKYRTITTASDTMGGVNNFSDAQGNLVSTPTDTGTSKLYGIYRGSTASPFSVRVDTINIGGAGDTTAPGQATVSIGAAVGGAALTVSATMPADIDVSEYEIRRLTTGYPAQTRTDGTVVVSPTATSASATVTLNDTSLTNSTRYYYRVFVKDTAGNWNTGSTASHVPHTLPTVVGWYTSAGVFQADSVTGANPILELTTAAANFEAGKAATLRCRVGLDNPGVNTPPTLSTTDYASSGGPGIWKYEDPASSGTFVTVPTTGLATSFFGRKLRLFTDLSGPSIYASVRFEQ